MGWRLVDLPNVGEPPPDIVAEPPVPLCRLEDLLGLHLAHGLDLGRLGVVRKQTSENAVQEVIIPPCQHRGLHLPQRETPVPAEVERSTVVPHEEHQSEEEIVLSDVAEG